MVGIPVGWSKFKLLGIRIMGNPPKQRGGTKKIQMGKNGLMCFMFHCEAFVRKSEDRNWCVQFKKIRYSNAIVIGKEVVFTAYKEVGRRCS